MTDREDRDGQAPRPHRPAPYADLTEMIDAAGGSGARSSGEIAAETAEALVRAGRESADPTRFVELADVIGIETLAALWRDADPGSLPGALWALYLLRQWCRDDGGEVTRLWRAGEPLAPAEAAVAGVADFADIDALRRFADAALTGVYGGDLDVALERAAAFFRVIAAGRRDVGAPSVDRDSPADDGAAEHVLAVRNDRVGEGLGAAARRWRDGRLH